MIVIISTPYLTEIEVSGKYTQPFCNHECHIPANFEIYTVDEYQDGNPTGTLLSLTHIEDIINKNLGEEKINACEGDMDYIYVNTYKGFEYGDCHGVAFISGGQLTSIVLKLGDARISLPISWVCERLKKTILNLIIKEYEII